MNQLKTLVASLLQHIPTSQRRRLRAIYEHLPQFGRMSHYAERGEDAFLQSYFRSKQSLTSVAQKALPLYWRESVGQGFYIDIGANAPVFYSNTYWFYLRGWRGINIDAAPGTMTAFNRFRPRDINIEALVSDQEAEVTFHYWETPFPANTASAEWARVIARQYGREPRQITMRSRRLDNLLDEHLSPDQDISFMSVDTEGHDLEVLRSNDWERFRPELVLVEDYMFDPGKSPTSEVHEFMKSVAYDVYAWIRPTVVYRRQGLQDWQDIVMTNLAVESEAISSRST